MHVSRHRHHADSAASAIAAAIGEPARARMLYCLMDGHARTSTELAVVGEVTPSTASVHLQRLKDHRLVQVVAQGKHRYYSLASAHVASALEALSVLAGAGDGAGAGNGARTAFVPNTPNRLRSARTCYDHIAGTLGVLLHDRFAALAWISRESGARDESYESYDLTAAGGRGFAAFGIDVDAARARRRRFAYACLDWSERRPHLAGALAAAFLDIALKKKWLLQDLDSRALSITRLGQRELQARFGVELTTHAS
jgi:DNA-binding transcriptional ArsR family regulator